MRAPLLGAATLLAVTTMLAAPPAVAAEATSTDDEPGRIVLVMDASGSMRDDTGGGQTRIEAAKQSLNSVVDALPESLEVGFRVFGSKGVNDEETEQCRASRRIVDVESDNRDALRAAIEEYTPFGSTPTGYALQQAGADLGDEGRRTIVLVSDGEPTCAPDPCEVAEQLSQNGIDLRIDVVGLDVAGAARDKLRCVADAGNGTYYDADDADSLTASLQATAFRASRPFDLTGTPVEGTATPADAPALERGLFLDELPLSDGLWYRVERTADRSTWHVGATHRSSRIGNLGEWLRISMYADQGETRCDTSDSFPRGSFGYTSASSWASDAESPCNTAETLWVHVERTHDTEDLLVGQPVEIAAYEEPPLADPTGRGLAAAPPEPQWETLEVGEPVTDLTPGSSNASAPVVEDGTYAFDINPGETQVVAVPLDWGQDVQAQLDSQLTEAFRDTRFISPDVQVLGPLRQRASVDFFASAPEDWTLMTAYLREGTNPFRLGAQSLTVGFLNRSSTSRDVKGAGLPGLRYVQVSYPDDADLPMEYTLTLRTNGEAGTGAPEYGDGPPAPEATSALVDLGDAGDDEAAAAADDEGTSTSGLGVPVLPLVLGVAGLAAVAAALVLLLRRRRG